MVDPFADLNQPRVNPLPGNRMAIIDFGKGSSGDVDQHEEMTVTGDVEKATALLSSMDMPEAIEKVAGSVHRPVLDIDFPAQLIPSTTEGHYHLLLDLPMEWPVYVKLLDVLAEVGVIEEGYALAAKRRGYSAVRLPWVPK